MTGSRRLEVPADAEGERLDRFLADRVESSRSQIQRWIDAGDVRVDGEVAKASFRLEPGLVVTWSPPSPEPPLEIEPEPGPLSVIHEDAHVVVVDKPAGLVVHPGAGRRSGTLVHRLLDRYPEMEGVGPVHRPGIVHRLDLDTSGVLVVARTTEARRSLVRNFRERRVEKRYLAVVYGAPDPDEGRIELPIGRHPTRRTEMTVRPEGRAARSDYLVRGSTAGISLLEVTIHTGRTHQIRVHLKAIGHPVVGDPVYGEARWKNLSGPASRARAALRDFPRPALHAWRLGFPHPADGETVGFEAPVPSDIEALWRQIAGTDPDSLLVSAERGSE